MTYNRNASYRTERPPIVRALLIVAIGALLGLLFSFCAVPYFEDIGGGGYLGIEKPAPVKIMLEGGIRVVGR